MSNSNPIQDTISSEEYFTELIVVICLGIIFLFLKLYSCCIFSGACNQGLELSERRDPVSQVQQILHQEPIRRSNQVSGRIYSPGARAVNQFSQTPVVRYIKIKPDFDQNSVCTQTSVYQASAKFTQPDLQEL